jgi:hypothetical protein
MPRRSVELPVKLEGSTMMVVMKECRILDRTKIDLPDLAELIRRQIPKTKRRVDDNDEDEEPETTPCILVYVDEEVVDPLVTQLKFIDGSRWNRKNIGDGVKLSNKRVAIWVGCGYKMLEHLEEFYDSHCRRHVVCTDMVRYLTGRETEAARVIWRTFSAACETQIHFSFPDKIVVMNPQRQRDLGALRRAQTRQLKKKLKGCVQCRSCFLVVLAILALLYLLSLTFGNEYEYGPRR